jgi:hypothetical protein
MPFERVKQSVKASLETQRNAEIQKEKAEEQERIKQQAQEQAEKLQQKKQLMARNYLHQCFIDSNIDAITDQLVSIVPEMRKSINSGGKSFITVSKTVQADGLLNQLLSITTDAEEVIDVSESIDLTWGNYGGQSSYGYCEIEVGFLDNGSLIVAGDKKNGITVIPENKWRTSRASIEMALEKAYLNPNDVYHRDYPDSTIYYDGR